MICPHCSKRIDDELITSYLGFVTGIEASAAVLGRKGGRSRSPRKLEAIRKNAGRPRPGRRVLTDAQIAEARASGDSLRVLAERYQCSRETIRRARVVNDDQ